MRIKNKFTRRVRGREFLFVVFLFVHYPFLYGWCPIQDFFLRKPEGQFPLGTLRRIRSVNNVPSRDQAEVSPDRPRGRLERIRGPNDGTCGVGSVLVSARPAHADDRSGTDVAHEGLEEGPILELCVVLLQQRFRGDDHLDGAEMESLVFKPLNDPAHKASLNTVWLDHDVGLIFDRRSRHLVAAVSNNSLFNTLCFFPRVLG